MSAALALAVPDHRVGRFGNFDIYKGLVAIAESTLEGPILQSPATITPPLFVQTAFATDA